MVGERPDEGLAATAELRSLLPDLLLAELTRSHSKALRHRPWMHVDEYFVARIKFEEVRIVLGRALEKRWAEIEYRERQAPRPSRHRTAN